MFRESRISIEVDEAAPVPRVHEEATRPRRLPRHDVAGLQEGQESLRLYEVRVIGDVDVVAARRDADSHSGPGRRVFQRWEPGLEIGDEGQLGGASAWPQVPTVEPTIHAGGFNIRPGER